MYCFILKLQETKVFADSIKKKLFSQCSNLLKKDC